MKLDDLLVEDLAKDLHDRDSTLWGSPAAPHLWNDCNDEHRERYRELARARLGMTSARP